MSSGLRKDETPGDGLERIAREEIDTIIAGLTDEAASAHRKVHTVRSRCKRLRAILRLARPVMGDRYRVEDARFRSAGRRLRRLRDAHVLRETAAMFEDPHRPISGASCDEGDFGILDESLSDMQRARTAIGSWKLRARSFYDIAAGLGRTYESARSAWRRVAEKPSDERFHRLRRSVKHLHFQTAVLEPVNEARLGPRKDQLDVLAERLGSGHDLAVLEQALEDSGEPAPRLMQRVAEKKAALYDDALTLCEKALADPTDRFVADVAAWWADWRAG